MKRKWVNYIRLGLKYKNCQLLLNFTMDPVIINTPFRVGAPHTKYTISCSLSLSLSFYIHIAFISFSFYLSIYDLWFVCNSGCSFDSPLTILATTLQGLKVENLKDKIQCRGDAHTIQYIASAEGIMHVGLEDIFWMAAGSS